MSLSLEKNTRYETKFNLSKLYSPDDLKKVFQVIPELTNLFLPANNSNQSQKNTIVKETQENINIPNYQSSINKFSFFKIILFKLKSYFELNESFIIIKTISFLINEIDNLEKFFSFYKNFSKKKLKNGQKSEIKTEKDNNSNQKLEKFKKINLKETPKSKIAIQKNNGLNTSNFNLLENSLNPFDINYSKKNKVYFRGLNNSSFKKECKTEINTFCSKFTYNNKKLKKVNINDSGKKTNSNDFSIPDLKKFAFQKQKTTSDIGLKIYFDSNDDSHFPNCSTNFDINSSNNKIKNNFINSENKGDLFNNNNNLYINIYEQKKNSGNSIESNSLNLQAKPIEQINIEKEDKINNDLLNISLLNKVETEDFNIFELDKNSSRKSLLLIGCYIFNRFGFHNIIQYSMFENWCRKIAQGYNRKNPYHTDLHAGDVTQTCLTFFKIGKVNELSKLTQLSKCSLFLSCICHDYKHPGVNNNYLKDSKNILAIKYNDKSILENMHISEAFKLTIDFPNCDIFSGMNSDDYKQMRKEMISCVLFTDVINHQYAIDFMKNIINKKKNNNKNEKIDEKDVHQDYMNLLIHSADISNPTKKFDIYWEWAQFVVEEFLRQGDKEKELGLHCSFDRKTLTVYQNQLGFINYMEIPFYTLFVGVFPKLKYLVDNLNNNKTQLLSLQEKEKGKTSQKENESKK